MDFLREIRLLYEAFYHLKCDITTKLDSLERCVRRQESMYDVIDNIDRKLAYLLPFTDAHNKTVVTSPIDSCCNCRFERSLPEAIYSAPPTVNVKNMDMFRSDTNLSYMQRKSRTMGMNKRSRCFTVDCPISHEIQGSAGASCANRSSSEEELPSKLKPEMIISELESKQDSGLESDSREHRSESSASLPTNDDEDPLMDLLSEIEERAMLSRKQGILQQISEADKCLNLVHERSKIASQRDLLNERLKSANLERENCQLKVKEMRRSVSTLETDKEWLLGRLEESIANKKQVMGKIGGMHSQFVKKSKTKMVTKSEANCKILEPTRSAHVPEMSKRDLVSSHELKKMKQQQGPQTKSLSEELKLKDIVQETNIVELRRKLIKSMIKNYTLQCKMDADDSQLECRSRVKGGTFTKVKAVSKFAPEIMPAAKSKIPTMKPKYEFEPSLSILTSQTLPENGNVIEREVMSSPEGSSCKTFLKTEKGDSFLVQIPETQQVEAKKVTASMRVIPR